MTFSINDFRSTMVFDGARPNLFEIYLTFPGQVLQSGTASNQITFKAKSATLPGRSMGVIDAFYFGRQIKIPGNVTFEDWTITVINDEDFTVRNAFENWGNLLDTHVANLRDPSMVNYLGYSTQAYALQYGKAGDVIKRYNFEGMWPSVLQPIDLDWGTNDTLEEFTVTLAYQYWTSDTPVATTDE